MIYEVFAFLSKFALIYKKVNKSLINTVIAIEFGAYIILSVCMYDIHTCFPTMTINAT